VDFVTITALLTVVSLPILGGYGGSQPTSTNIGLKTGYKRTVNVPISELVQDGGRIASSMASLIRGGAIEATFNGDVFTSFQMERLAAGFLTKKETIPFGNMIGNQTAGYSGVWDFLYVILAGSGQWVLTTADGAFGQNSLYMDFRPKTGSMLREIEVSYNIDVDVGSVSVFAFYANKTASVGAWASNEPGYNIASAVRNKTASSPFTLVADHNGANSNNLGANRVLADDEHFTIFVSFEGTSPTLDGQVQVTGVEVTYEEPVF